MSKKVTELVGMAEKLDSAELTELYKRIGALLQFSGGVVQAADADETMVLEVIIEVMARLGVEYPTIAMLRRYKGYRDFADKVPGVMQFVRKACKNKVGQRSLLALGVHLLYRRQTEIGLETGARNLMSNIHRLPPVLNMAFPSYAENGILSLAVGERIT